VSAIGPVVREVSREFDRMVPQRLRIDFPSILPIEWPL
jgi:hypothetical protein